MAAENQSFEEEHESNGPEGSRGLPMQPMSPRGIAFVLITLFGSGALAWCAIKQANMGKPTQ